MKNFVISLSNATQRRVHIHNEFSKHNVPYQIFDALHPSKELNELIEEHLPNLKNANLTNGEKACFMSHFMLWKKCIDENIKCIAIFEDDVILGDDSEIFLRDFNWIENRVNLDECFILKLETFLMPVKIENCEHIKSFRNREFKILKQVHYGTAGYIISNSAIKYLMNKLNSISSTEFEGIDIMIFGENILKEKMIIIYQLYPSICVQEMQLNKSKSVLLSQIEYERKHNHKKNRVKPKRNFLEKIIHILTKMKRIKKKKEARKNIIPFL